MGNSNCQRPVLPLHGLILAIDVPIENAQETAFRNCSAGTVGEVTP
jgi:hypothetical protein